MASMSHIYRRHFLRAITKPLNPLKSAQISSRTCVISGLNLTAKPAHKILLKSFSSAALNDTETSSTSSHNPSKVQAQFLSPDAYDPVETQKNVLRAAQWNQGTGTKGAWDPKYCHEAISSYTNHLRYLLDLKKKNNDTESIPSKEFEDAASTILCSHTTERALKVMLKTKLPTHLLSRKVRDIERLIGSIGLTPLTDPLSLRLLEANGKAGNVGRTIALLNLRNAKGYRPIRKEFEYAIQSIISAGLYLRKNRNVFLKEQEQPEIDNPTRWLDAILVNMSARGVALDTRMANRMLDCYASTGRSGKAIHFFYKVTKEYAKEDNDDVVIRTNGDTLSGGVTDDMPVFDNRKTKVRMRMRQHMPPYYKLPSDVKLNGDLVKLPNRDEPIPKLEWEKEQDFSLSLTSAFAFADSLTHGACGHQPIQLDNASWNILIKACCYRGAIWRALEILNETMPKNNIVPDSFSYNTILSGVARVGDKDFMKEVLTTMTNQSINADKYTVQALVDGYLNSGDISGAVTLVQDMFNQHGILPPYTSHLKIIEFALGNDLVYEAKRQVYFIQQLWKWSPSEGDSEGFKRFMSMTQKNPKLSKASLKRMFRYFGEELYDADFF